MVEHKENNYEKIITLFFLALTSSSLQYAMENNYELTENIADTIHAQQPQWYYKQVERQDIEEEKADELLFFK